MIPILRKDEIEAGAEELLLRLCPNALSDLNEHNAFVLAERMRYSHADARAHKILCYFRYI